MICKKCNHRLPDDSKFCQYCGSPIGKEVAPIVAESTTLFKTATLQSRKNNNTLRSTSAPRISIISIILSTIAILSIIIAINIQDTTRNTRESISPTLLYLILIVFYIIHISLCFFAQKEKFFLAQHIFLIVLSVFTVFTFFEGSLFSKTYINFHNQQTYTKTYMNSDIVSICNISWVLMFVTILIINIPSLITKMQKTWHSCIRYRESRYKRVIKMKEYLDNGIITEEEFEKNKKEILKHINFK